MKGWKKILIFILIVVGLISLYYSVSALVNFYSQGGKKIKNSVAEATSQTKTDKAREIKIEASQFKFNPNTINVKKGERIKLVINNLDVTHGLRIPDLGVQGNDFVEFIADKQGDFTFYCNNYCGENHPQMQGKLIVE